MKSCSIENCESPHVARGWCEAHYARWSRHGDPLAGRAAPRPGAICSIENCEKFIRARGLCVKHYKRFLLHGDANYTVHSLPGKPTVGRPSGNGYIVVSVHKDDPYAAMAWQMSGNNGLISLRMLQHRYVMAQHLGRCLLPSETVHHINGDGTDNRIDNLQLRQGGHGVGVVYRCLDCQSQNVEAVPIGA